MSLHVELWYWLGYDPQFTNGVTNQDVYNKFGIEVKETWVKMKRNHKKQDGLFYEDGRWYRWHRN